jgi:sterol desaturase/sphingolipid hydroxylase (fatty acid hydroxylase superfamily)
LDYLLLFVNGSVRTLLVIPVLGSHLAGAFVVASFLQRNVADPAVTSLSWLTVAALFSVTLFIADDASRFALHRMMHRWEPLWRLHKVHHSATTLTPFTVFRVHPIESICYYTRGLLVFSIIAGIFIWLFKGKLTALEIMGVDAIGFVFNLAAANLRHSHIYVGFGRLEAHIISPAQHQLHHSLHHDHPNFGSCLAWWDRMAATLTASKGIRVHQFGIAESAASERQQPTSQTAYQQL